MPLPACPATARGRAALLLRSGKCSGFTSATKPARNGACVPCSGGDPAVCRDRSADTDTPARRKHRAPAAGTTPTFELGFCQYPLSLTLGDFEVRLVLSCNQIDQNLLSWLCMGNLFYLQSRFNLGHGWGGTHSNIQYKCRRFLCRLITPSYHTDPTSPGLIRSKSCLKAPPLSISRTWTLQRYYLLCHRG